MALAEYDAIRNRLKGDFSQKRSEADDALKRRFAMQGMLGSGAYQKSAELQGNDMTRAEAESLQNLDLQEQNELQRRKEVVEGRQFQTGEREGAQRFAAEEAAKGRTFQTGERLGSQDFARGERLGTQEWQQGNMDREFDMNQLNNYINALVALKDAGFSSNELGGTQWELEKLGMKMPSQLGTAYMRRMRG